MTDNEIIKALENCMNGGACVNCPYQGQCETGILAEVAVDLIKRQQAEIEALTLINSTYNAETEEIREIAIKEFADRLKQKVQKYTQYDEGGWGADVYAVSVDAIDNLVKEMAEGKHDR